MPLHNTQMLSGNIGCYICKHLNYQSVAKLSYSRLRHLVPKRCMSSQAEDFSSEVETSLQKADTSGKYVAKKSLPKLKEPIVKNFFLGKLERSMLVYPELTKEELDQVNSVVAPIEKMFSEIDSKSIDANAKIPEDVLQQLKDFGLFGLQIPEQYGGLNLSSTAYARVTEVTSTDGSIAVTLAAHQSIGLKGILIAGTEIQKEKYLPKLASGENIAAFCLTEPSSGSDVASIKTRATLSEDGKYWILNGSKIWISNGSIADVFTVFAKTEIKTSEGETQEKITAFIVERAFGGITSGKPEDKLGIRGSNTCEVHFDNTRVPTENVLGEVGNGFKLAMHILNSGRFSMGSGGAGVLKKLINLTAQHAITRSQFGEKLSSFGLIKEKFAKMAISVYAMESMSYLTAHIMDDYLDPDMSIESAVIKIFSSESCWNCVSECLQIMGGSGYTKDLPHERYLRDSRIMQIFEGTNEILRLFVALQGLQFAGRSMKDTFLKLRDPHQNPLLMFKKRFRRSMGKAIIASTEPDLFEEVHLELEKEARILSSCLVSLGMAVEDILPLYGNKVVNEQMKLRRLADIAIDLYAMLACIGRASRSYCIGLKNSDHEVLLTRSFCYEADQRIKRNIYELTLPGESKIEIDDINRLIADIMFKSNGYAAEHPLARNW
ncbi:complex I assembly factor ACAD9, mitochondrial-like isoform X2 [Biomphalaria glabrata]|nr:complex I assembly factor ACAD9, mitochondrial-like isoform X2 [Biomphalaria glabrata]